MRLLVTFPTTAAALVAAVVFWCSSCGPAGPSDETTYHYRGEIFGTTYKITIADWHLHPTTVRDQALGRIRAKLEEVDQALSTYQADSDLSRFSRARNPKAVEVQEVTWQCLDLAHGVFEASQGCFDPTVGPAVRLWGFGWDRALGERKLPAPSPEAIAEARANIGWDQVELWDPIEAPEGPRSLRSENPKLELDCSAIAKGLAVDLVCTELSELGFEHFLVEIGGELRCIGRRPGGGPWRLWIESPLPDDPDLATAIELDQRSLATSGDYRNFRILADGRQISHTIDPRTALPVESPPLSVSVIGDLCALTDAWATALSVAGEDGLAWIEALPDLEARMVLRPAEVGGEPRIVTTSGWPADPRPAAMRDGASR